MYFEGRREAVDEGMREGEKRGAVLEVGVGERGKEVRVGDHIVVGRVRRAALLSMV